MREFKVKLPFVGYAEIIVEIDNEHEFDSEKELKEAAREKAENEFYNNMDLVQSIERLEVQNYVEGTNEKRYRCVDNKFDYEIEDITIEEEEEDDE